MRGALLLAALCSWSGAAWSQTDEIQVYDAEITAPGHFNLTWHNNFTPEGRTEPAYPGGIVPNHALNGVPEWAYGVTDWFEQGLYLPVYTRTGDGELLLDATKVRELFVVPHAHDRTFFYGVNFELSYNAPHWEPTRFSGEIRPIVSALSNSFRRCVWRGTPAASSPAPSRNTPTSVRSITSNRLTSSLTRCSR